MPGNRTRPSESLYAALLALLVGLSACGPSARLQVPTRLKPDLTPASLESAPPAAADEVTPPPPPAAGGDPASESDEDSEQSGHETGPEEPPGLPAILDPAGQAPLPLPGILDPGGVLDPHAGSGFPLFPGLPMLTGSVARQVNFEAYRDADQGGRTFNRYVLKAIDYIDARYAGLGYDIRGALTRAIPFGQEGEIRALRPPRTMCVAAQLEILLIAYHLYFRETGDTRPFVYLPKRSYERLGSKDLRGHIWVNSKFNSSGTADAFINFGMGERVEYARLRPGDFINLNRTNGTGHAVTFIAFIDRDGNPLAAWDESRAIGFRYYSSQGKAARGQGGFGYRDAVFSKHGCPATLKRNKRDCGVVYSPKQTMLNTGTLLAPRYWDHGARDTRLSTAGADAAESTEETVLDAAKFGGLTTDD